ncbi:DUF1365 domain-containing protein [Phenylobacterium sp.]|uniref:DUF1365 domain-containing protein n=1 Tax=Phenylobacterium sp. TaxID=1871053 RepID=UPI002733B75B|nr:DUF1365 domain-containing protein [Phenylobacterium sp.]MDP3660852.1 DUF1365 domain-containing protein [Phenylobacterium sp.]
MRLLGLYCGSTAHVRIRPRPHRLRYRIFMLLLELGAASTAKPRLFSVGRFNLLGFEPRDHGDGSDTPLKAQVEARLAAAGIAGGGAIRLLCMPRILGRGFNPLSVYYCHARDGRLAAVLYEVNNTFGERRCYLIPAEPDDGGRTRQTCAKDFYVSPFMDMALDYDFDVAAPDAAARIAITARDAQGPVLQAWFTGRRSEPTDGNLLRAWITHPWMTLGVLAAIYVEAVKIFLKGEPVRPHRVGARSSGAEDPVAAQ